MRLVKRFLKGFVSIAVVAFISEPGNVSALTLSDIRTEVRRNVKDTGSTRQRFSDSLLNSFINEGQRDFVNRTWALRKTANITLTDATTFYSLQSDLIAINFLYRTNANDQVTILDERKERSFRQQNPDFLKDAGASTDYFVRITTSTNNPLEVGFWPAPNTGNLGTITYQYVSQTTDMSSDSDVPFDGLDHMIPYHEALIYYASARASIIEGLTNRAQTYNTVYELKVGITRERIGNSPNFNPSFRTRPLR